MQTYDFEQGSEQWFAVRTGIPTASQFDRIVTPKKLELSKQSWDYLCELCAERILGQPHDVGASQFMRRGSELEEEAISWYAWDRNVDVQPIGFCATDDGSAGCSPDGLVGDDGLVETKCPAAKTHVGYMLEPQRLVDAYRIQVQGELWVTERVWCDLVAWHPTLRPVVVRCMRDDEAIEDIASAVTQFAERVNEALESLGYGEAVKRVA